MKNVSTSQNDEIFIPIIYNYSLVFLFLAFPRRYALSVIFSGAKARANKGASPCYTSKIY